MPTITTNKFKIGDMVRVISKSVPGYEHFSNSGIQKGDVGYINGIVGNPYSFNDDGNCFLVGKEKTHHSGNFFAINDLELVEEESIKVGDRVRVCVPRDSDAWKFDDEIGKVKEITNDGDPYPICVVFGNDDEEHFKLAELEKVD